MKRLLAVPLLLLLSLNITFNALSKLNNEIEIGLSMLANGQNCSARVSVLCLHSSEKG